MAEVVSICYSPDEKPKTATGYYRVPIPTALLVARYGIEGDRKGGGRRQLNVMSAETLTALAEQGFDTEAGRMGEQLVVAGLDVDALASGSRLHIGEAVVEVVKPRTGCGKFTRYQQHDFHGVPLGVIARVLTGGPIAVGDAVRLETEAETA